MSILIMFEILFFIFIGAFLAYTYPEPNWFFNIRMKIMTIINTLFH